MSSHGSETARTVMGCKLRAGLHEGTLRDRFQMLAKIIVFGFILFQTLATAVRCPTHPKHVKNCTYDLCFYGGICYNDLEVVGTYGIETLHKANICCQIVDRFCSATGMLTFHDVPDAEPQFKHIKTLLWNKTAMDNKKFYMDIYSLAGCPYPYSYDTINLKFELPVYFHRAMRQRISNCKTNADCADDEYCGQAYNAVYNGIDQSDANRKPKMFCYNKHTLHFPFYLVPKRGNYDTGLPICNDHSDCFLHSLCYELPGKVQIRAAPHHVGYGFCVESYMCRGDNMVSRYGVRMFHYDKFGRPGFCEKDEDCKINKEFKNDYYIPHCVPTERPLPAGNQTVKMCCYETQPLCDYGYKIPGDKKCNTHADCNEGKEMGKWYNWCDRTGVCCAALPKPYPGEDTKEANAYGIVANFEAFRCPDSITYLFAEEPCIDVNISDPFSGKCPISDSALCKNGHCCPDTMEVLNKNGTIERLITSNTTFISNHWCDPAETAEYPYMNAYCDLNRQTIIIVSDSVAEKVTDKNCEKPMDCDDGETCMRLPNFIKKCFVPLKLPTTVTKIASTTASTSEHREMSDSSNSTFLPFSFSSSSSSSIFSDRHEILSFIILLVFIY